MAFCTRELHSSTTRQKYTARKFFFSLCIYLTIQLKVVVSYCFFKVKFTSAAAMYIVDVKLALDRFHLPSITFLFRLSASETTANASNCASETLKSTTKWATYATSNTTDYSASNASESISYTSRANCRV